VDLSPDVAGNGVGIAVLVEVKSAKTRSIFAT